MTIKLKTGKAPRKSQLKYHVMNHEDYQASSIGVLSQHKNTDHKNEAFDLQVSKELPTISKHNKIAT